jgi:polyferredoxin
VSAAALLADLILALHALVVAFVVLGQVAIMAGGVLGWRAVRGLALRITHLGLVVYVAVQAWAGVACPLTVWEQALRRAAGQRTHEISFVEYWLSRLIFYQAPTWVFVAVYSAFALLVAVSWWRWPPRRSRG